MSTQKVDRAFEAIKTVIDEACAPRNLTMGEYKEVLEQLAEEVRERLQMTTMVMTDNFTEENGQ